MPLDAKTLYQELILDHGKHPRNQGPLASATHEATAHNPLCGDRVTIHLHLEGDRVAEARFEARGCMIARASASLLTEAIAGRGASDALSLAATMDALATAPEPPADLGALEPLRGVREFPARIKCATIAWEALREALQGPARSPSAAR
jgi:nitrogen fixation NifU-like protein